jgi:hypothetical protein
MSEVITITKDPGSVYQGELTLPRAAREQHDVLMREWFKTDPAWSSDEHEFCVWLAKLYPSYFATENPFIGYVQVRVEGESRRMRVGAMRIEQSWSVSGFTSFSKRKARTTTGEKWFFDLSKYMGQGHE